MLGGSSPGRPRPSSAAMYLVKSFMREGVPPTHTNCGQRTESQSARASGHPQGPQGGPHQQHQYLPELARNASSPPPRPTVWGALLVNLMLTQLEGPWLRESREVRAMAPQMQEKQNPALWAGHSRFHARPVSVRLVDSSLLSQRSLGLE